MKKRLTLLIVAGGAIGAFAPLAAAHASAPAPQVPSACVVTHLPGGASVQVGYAPSGPQGCRQING